MEYSRGATAIILNSLFCWDAGVKRDQSEALVQCALYNAQKYEKEGHGIFDLLLSTRPDDKDEEGEYQFCLVSKLFEQLKRSNLKLFRRYLKAFVEGRVARMVENGNTRRNYPALESMTCCVLFLLAQVEPETVDRWPEAPYTSFDKGDLWRKYLEVFREDVIRPTQSGILPLHYAIRLGCIKPIIADGPSVVCNLVEKCPEAASQTDKSGRTALHLIAELVEVWDEGAEAILNAHPPAARLRAGPELHNRLAIHIAAARPDADRSLIEHLVQVHPRGVALADSLGRLPLHLACEAAKTWDNGVRAIYDAFPDAIRQAEENERSWMPLTMAAACPQCRCRSH
jgi:hypothetical protein